MNNNVKRFFAVTFIVALFVGLVGFQPASAADNAKNTDYTSAGKKAAGKTKKNFKCKKTPKSFVKNGITVINMKTCFNIQILKRMGCDTEAGKNEQPAPPRDPRSECKGWLKVDFMLKMKSPKPPEGMLCTEFSMSITIKQRMKARALSISIANGRVDTWARTNLKLKDVVKGWIKTNCVRIPEEPEVPNEPEVPTYGPSVDVTPVACVNPGATRDVTVRVYNPNGKDDNAKVSYRGNVYTKAVSAHEQAMFTFPSQGQGTYSGTALLVKANKSASFMVTVELCPTTTPPPTPTCESVYGPGYTGTYPNCFKDGNTTPPPPAEVPGPNPTPADPGQSSMCYSETTGRPVSPNPDGSCPIGSFGG